MANLPSVLSRFDGGFPHQPPLELGALFVADAPVVSGRFVAATY
jgi:hypothetical protein